MAEFVPDTTQLPFNASIKKNNRAKRLRLKIDVLGNVIVVKPRLCTMKMAIDFLHSQSAWIQRMLNKHGHSETSHTTSLPTIINLEAISQCYTVATESTGRGIKLKGNTLTIHNCCSQASPESTKHTIGRLQKWLADMGKEYLIPQLENLAQDMGISVEKISIRNQKTRWGSCSFKGGISLNQKLLLVSPEQCRYVLIHELCHRQQMNHSQAFWKLVEHWQPNHRQLDKSLNFRDLPRWALL